MAKGIDTTYNVTKHIAQLKASGITFVCRYSSHSSWKNITVPEVHALSNADISIVNVWETSGGDPEFGGTAYFTLAQGKMDGASSYVFAKHLGQPFTAPIYYAVDCDIITKEDSDRVRDYFYGIRESLQKHGQIGKTTYSVGVYGSGAVCKDMKMIGYVSYTWLAQSLGWKDSRTYRDWNIKQGPAVHMFGMDVDTDESNGHGGGWQLS